MENPATKQQSVGRRVRTVTLIPLEADDGDQFVRDNQAAFKYGSLVVRRRRRADGKVRRASGSSRRR